jgi:hypothetical protein
LIERKSSESKLFFKDGNLLEKFGNIEGEEEESEEIEFFFHFVS